MPSRREEMRNAARRQTAGLEPSQHMELQRAVEDGFRRSPAAALLAIRTGIIAGFKQTKADLQSNKQLRFTANIVRSTGTAMRAGGKVRARGDRVISFRASTPTLDRHGTVIRSEGIDTTRFDRNPIFLWSHDGYNSMFGGPSLDSVIGKVTAHRKTKQAFDIDVQFAEHETAQKAFELVKSGFLSAVSIGFVPLKSHEEEINGRSVPVYDAVELLEVSLVSIPSNADATVTHRAMAGTGKRVEPVARAMRDTVRELKAETPRQRALRQKIERVEARTAKLEQIRNERMAEEIGSRIVKGITTKFTTSRSDRENRISETLRGVKKW